MSKCKVLQCQLSMRTLQLFRHQKLAFKSGESPLQAKLAKKSFQLPAIRFLTFPTQPLVMTSCLLDLDHSISTHLACDGNTFCSTATLPYVGQWLPRWALTIEYCTILYEGLPVCCWVFFIWVSGVIEINLAITMPEQTSIINTRRNIITIILSILL